ncbi:MAG: CarD family transcriptional regulator [Clostridium sp.]|uniref:CarD family transcriptional regulator n=1 Tax=Clostridium sp. TaxID=1506 RepID=UPI003999A5AF
MFSKNEYVVYGSTGVCKIIDIVTKKIGNTKERLYYLLKPEYETNSIIYAPIDNNSVVMRKIITKDEIYELIKKCQKALIFGLMILI